MTKEDGQLTKSLKKWGWPLAIACLIGSAKLSVAGVGLGGDLWWMGWVTAACFTISQFIVNGSYEKELNWTIFALGVGSYIASIWMNILGIYDYKAAKAGITVAADFNYVWSNFDIGIILLGIFFDAFPEMYMRWSLGESKIGDFIGNWVKIVNNPQMLTNSLTITSSTRRMELERQYRNPPTPNFQQSNHPIKKYPPEHA